MNSHSLLWRSTLRLGRFSMPIIGMSLLNMAASFFAMLFVAHFGKDELAAGALAVSTYITLSVIASSTLYAVGILIGHSRGQQSDEQEIGIWVKQGAYLACAMSIPLGALLYNGEHILALLRLSPSLIARTRDYFHYAALSLFPSLLGVVISQFYIGIGKPRVTMLASLLSSPSIVLLSYPLILGEWGAPQMRLAGITLATASVQFIYCTLMLYYIANNRSIGQFAVLSGSFRFSWPRCKRLLSIGLPIGIQFGGELGAMTVGTYLMGLFGVSALAATQIVSQYTLLAVMITLGLSQAVSVLASESYGKRNYQELNCYVVAGAGILTTFFALIIGLFLLEPLRFIGVYVNIRDPNNAAVVHLSVLLFMVAAFSMYIDSLRNLLSGALRGLHDSKAPMHIGVICLWCCSLPVAYGVAFVFHMGPIGLRIGFASGFVLATVLLLIRYRGKLKLRSGAYKMSIIALER